MKNPKNGFKNFYFFIGTEAEFIKLFPVLLELEKNNVQYKIISSGQNKIYKSELFNYLKKKTPDIVLSNKEITQTISGLSFWFFATFFKSLFILSKEFKGLDKKQTFIVIHGDTISTPMGAILGKLFRVKVAHVEAGLRSYDLLNPFPEEIDRIVASRLSDLFFSSNQWAIDNLKHRNGMRINTKQNTLYDSIQFALKINKRKKVNKKGKYFIFVMHRTENIYNKDRVMFLLSQIATLSKKMSCIFIMHEPTRIRLEKMNLLEDLKKNSNVKIIARQSFFNFISLLKDSELIITDGGSNQEESFYLGKPCLILRRVTERTEGLGINAVLSKNNQSTMEDFIRNYIRFKREPLNLSFSPSKIIVDYLTKS